ncbi:MAG: APC family permease [Myxococcales bacterium]|nr:APC family permease [Myxococcota bacterium]MDW8284308.1 APC family permease [Myxococcales bacterium]
MSLCAATFFVVSGGPYGLEEIIAGHGYARTLGLLLIVPLVWSLPVALMVGELGGALPQEGGYYAWVRRALGPFWGFQQAFLMLATSLFDMAIYPTLFVTYLGRLWPEVASTAPGQPGWWIGVSLIAVCTLWNIRGSRAVGVGATALGGLLLLPFVLLAVLALVSLPQGGLARAAAALSAPPPAEGSPAWVGGIILCMWNYMGWDNASTVASEVHDPQRTYPRAMLLTVLVVAACYALPVLAASASGMPAEAWTAGSWVEAAQRLGGPPLGLLVVLGGMLCSLGMFNVLVMSYSRLPVALAEDGMLPRALAVRDPRTGAPTLAIVASAALYAACLGLGLRRLIELDVMLYGVGLVLEFVALGVLRVREPALPRPFRIPGGLPGVLVLSTPPILLLGAALWTGRHEAGPFGLSALELSGLILLGGPAGYLLYLLARLPRTRHEPPGAPPHLSDMEATRP